MSLWKPLEHEPPKFGPGAILRIEDDHGDEYTVLVCDILPADDTDGTRLRVQHLGWHESYVLPVKHVTLVLADAQWLANNLDPHLFDLRNQA